VSTHPLDEGALRALVPRGGGRRFARTASAPRVSLALEVVHADDPLVEAAEAALVLGHDLRREAAGPVAWLLDPHRAVLGVNRLRRDPVAGVADTAGGACLRS